MTCGGRGYVGAEAPTPQRAEQDGEASSPLQRGRVALKRLGRREKSPRRSAAATKAEMKDAGLPDTNRRDPHKSGESPPLHGQRHRIGARWRDELAATEAGGKQKA